MVGVASRLSSADFSGSRQLRVGFSGSRQLRVGLSGSRPWDSAYLGVVPGTRHILESSLGLGLRGAARPDVLKGSGARVSLPVAHYSDNSPRSWGGSADTVSWGFNSFILLVAESGLRSPSSFRPTIRNRTRRGPPHSLRSSNVAAGNQAACLIRFPAVTRHCPVAQRHVGRIVCLPTRVTGHAVRRGPPLPRLGMRTDPLRPHGRLGFPRCYCAQ